MTSCYRSGCGGCEQSEEILQNTTFRVIPEWNEDSEPSSFEVEEKGITYQRVTDNMLEDDLGCSFHDMEGPSSRITNKTT